MVSITGSKFLLSQRVLGDQGKLSWDSAFAGANKPRQTLIDVSAHQTPQPRDLYRMLAGAVKFVHPQQCHRDIRIWWSQRVSTLGGMCIFIIGRLRPIPWTFFKNKFFQSIRSLAVAGVCNYVSLLEPEPQVQPALAGQPWCHRGDQSASGRAEGLCTASVFSLFVPESLPADRSLG